MLLLYNYIVDMGLALGISKKEQNIIRLRIKDVNVKWGLLEPVLYGFIVLTPLGLIRLQIWFVLILALIGLTYQLLKYISKYKPVI